jgi:hypothetical protein
MTVVIEGNVNAAKYRQKILEPFFEELHADELQEGYFQQEEKLEEKLKKLITPRTC